VSRRVLLLGGVDPSGGAGITADAIVVALHGAQPLPVPVCLTVQGARGFRGAEPVPERTWRAAIDAVLGDGPVQAIKLGMLGDAATASAVAAVLAPLRGHVPIVVDPVLSATAGGFAPAQQLASCYRERLLPLASLFTPNLPELGRICDGRAELALAAGARAVLVKGGHGDGRWSEDQLFAAGAQFVFRRPRLDVGSVRGTGCALASAIAVRLAAGEDVSLACQRAGDWLAALLQRLGPPAADGLPRPLPWAAVPLPTLGDRTR
jgi:hydroxymethylpyrimidine/phosphomethylpyrimidine kinase